MKLPYAMTAAMPTDQRHAQMAHALAIAAERNYPRLTAVPISSIAALSIVGYGPSLHDTWQQLRDPAARPILSMSGATRFLADRGIIADYHVDMDPRAHKAKHLTPPIPGVHYLMASVCPPETWELLRDQRVTLWHTYSGTDSEGLTTYSWVAKHDRPGEFVLRGGTTIGLTALHLGGLLGYRHFEVYGMDGSCAAVADGDSQRQRHAGVHYGTNQSDTFTWDAERRTYHTTQIMANAVAETINTISRFPIFCVFHGDGLTQALVREANVPNACTVNQLDKLDRVRRGIVRVVALPPANVKTTRSYWDALVDQLPPTTLPELIMILQQAEPLRRLARYNTGSIPLETALLLRALCHYHQPTVIAEVGTFIGVSTYALSARHALYTCDSSNDCVVDDPTRGIRVHPYTSSTVMFERMLDDGYEGRVDLFFFDGRIQPADLDLIERLGHARSIFVFDDCSTTPGADKGRANMAVLQPRLPDHAVIPPSPAYAGRSTLGALVPLLQIDLPTDLPVGDPAATPATVEQLQCV